MSKLSSLKAQLSRTAAPATAATVESVDEAPRSAAKPTMAPSRVGKVHLGAYLHRDFKRSLMLVRAATGKTETQIIADALNDVFRTHNVPVIDAE